MSETPSALFVTTVPVTLELFLAPLARHFRAVGWRVDALANGAARGPELADAFDARYDAAWTRNPLAPSNLIGTAGRVRRLVETNRYDIVHVHTPIAAFVTRFALRSLRRRPGGPVVIYTAHGFHFYRGGRPLANALYRAMERVAAGWTDVLVTINDEDFSAARGFGTIPAERVRLIPGIGVDVDRYAEAPDPVAVAAVAAELELPEDAFIILMVAEFGAVKRHALLLDALARVDARVVVVFVGSGPLEADVRARVEQLGLSGRVRFAGYRRDVPTLLAAADALALVSEREGLPRSVLEAMAAGTPVIGTDTRGITDAVGDTGWIVPKHDVDALARTIEAAASDPEEAARKGARAKVRARERFSLDAVIAAYEELYRDALS